METIDIKELINYFISKIAVVILSMIIACIIGTCYGLFVQVPKYKSTTSVILKNDSTQDTNLTVNDLNMNKNLVGTYSEIIKSKRILSKVIDNLKLKYSVSQLSSNIQVISVTETELIKIVAVDTNSKTAKLIANEAANVFVEEIPELYNISNVSILDQAEIATAPYNINIKKQLIIYLMAGLLFGCGIVLIIYYFDRTIKSVEQIDKLGLTFLGGVQEYKKGNK